MSQQTYDANGNLVTDETSFCFRCGAHIKHIYTWNGHTYGSECIEIVTGIGKDFQVFNNREFDLAASQAKKLQTEKNRAEQLKKYEESRRAAQDVQRKNAERFEEVIYLLENTSGDFAASVVSQIKRTEKSTELYDILSYRQFAIVAEIYGKSFGRKGSKGYEAGVEEFYQKYGEKE